MKRYVIAELIGKGTEADPYRPDVSGAFVVVGQVGARCAVKMVVADGAAKTAATLADCDGGGAVVATPLTLAQRATIKAWLSGRGLDVSRFDGDVVSDRRKLLGFIARRVLGRAPWVVEQMFDID